MYLIDRSAAVLSIRQPFVDWINSLDDGMPQLTLESLNSESHVYLLPEYDTEQELVGILKEIYPVLFQLELVAFCKDDDLWPEIEYGKFREWFDVQVHSMVFDPYEDEIEREDFYDG
jgi:hypothetical protein